MPNCFINISIRSNFSSTYFCRPAPSFSPLSIRSTIRLIEHHSLAFPALFSAEIRRSCFVGFLGSTISESFSCYQDVGHELAAAASRLLLVSEWRWFSILLCFFAFLRSRPSTSSFHGYVYGETDRRCACLVFFSLDIYWGSSAKLHRCL